MKKNSFLSLAVMCLAVVVTTSSWASAKFDSQCGLTSANSRKDITLNNYFVDSTGTSNSSRVIYVSSEDGRLWKIPTWDSFPQNQMHTEMRHVALTAVLSGAKVNICADNKTSPETIWGIEIFD